MRRYEDIASFLSTLEVKSDLTTLSESETAHVREVYPQIPEDYLDYLRYIGWGSLGQDSFMIYSGPIKPEDIYDPETACELSHILFFGDGFQGYCAGFDTRDDWQVVEVGPTDMSIDKIGESFEAFIRSWMIARLGAV